MLIRLRHHYYYSKCTVGLHSRPNFLPARKIRVLCSSWAPPSDEEDMGYRSRLPDFTSPHRYENKSELNLARRPQWRSVAVKHNGTGIPIPQRERSSYGRPRQLSLL